MFTPPRVLAGLPPTPLGAPKLKPEFWLALCPLLSPALEFWLELEEAVPSGE